MPPLPANLTDWPLRGQGLAGALGRQPLISPVTRELEELLARPPRQRSKLWEFGTNLHCSIIGTCLSTGELRQILTKSGRKEAAGATEHDIHASAVLLAGKHHDGAKLLHKALDRRHRVAISQFDKAKSTEEVRALWREASKRGDIPGAYWAALTHPSTNDVLVREIFTEVHMLSHLVGAANRADIRRLRQLEAENADLEARLAQQQERLQDVKAARDRARQELKSHGDYPRIVMPPVAVDSDRPALEARLARCERRREQVENELVEARAALAAEQQARLAVEAREIELRRELDAIEASFGGAIDGDDNPPDEKPLPPLGLTLLYVGGRPAQIGHLRLYAERAGAAFLYHDGGVEEREGLLPGLVSRADTVLFPVNCISHKAMLQLKRLCRQAGKKFVPLRGMGIAPLHAALRELAPPVVEG